MIIRSRLMAAAQNIVIVRMIIEIAIHQDRATGTMMIRDVMEEILIIQDAIQDRATKMEEALITTDRVRNVTEETLTILTKVKAQNLVRALAAVVVLTKTGMIRDSRMEETARILETDKDRETAIRAVDLCLKVLLRMQRSIEMKKNVV